MIHDLRRRRLAMSDVLPSFQSHDLGDGHVFWTGALPAALRLEGSQFEVFWGLHPARYHEIRMHGRSVRTPRWQQAYGEDYHYAGRVNSALPVPPQLEALGDWIRENIDERINGLLLNWYDGKLGHRIGRHRDSRVNLVSGAPIVTVSFGEERLFRLRPWPSRPGAHRVDFHAHDGAVFVMPFETNLAWTHEVPSGKKWTARRISVTGRAFKRQAPLIA